MSTVNGKISCTRTRTHWLPVDDPIHRRSGEPVLPAMWKPFMCSASTLIPQTCSLHPSDMCKRRFCWRRPVESRRKQLDGLPPWNPPSIPPAPQPGSAPFSVPHSCSKVSWRHQCRTCRRAPICVALVFSCVAHSYSQGQLRVSDQSHAPQKKMTTFHNLKCSAPKVLMFQNKSNRKVSKPSGSLFCKWIEMNNNNNKKCNHQVNIKQCQI